MSAPDTQLCRLYGTTKEASEGAVARRLGALVLGLGISKVDKSVQDAHAQEAAALNEVARAQEAERMEAMIAAMKTASAAGRMLAHTVPASELEKDAFGAFIGKALGAAKSALTPGWKSKALATAGTIGAGVAGYKGLSALRSYASQPIGDQQWGTKRSLKHNVSEWGYPVS